MKFLNMNYFITSTGIQIVQESKVSMKERN